MAGKPQITPESIRSDLINVVGLLRAIDAILPEHVPADLLNYLTLTAENPIALDLLARALTASQPGR